MMRAMANKKNVKIISVIVAAIFILGVAGLAYMQMNTPAVAAPDSKIGVVDTSQAIRPDSPMVIEARQELQDYYGQLKGQFDQKAAKMSDEEKQKLSMEMQQKMMKKQSEIQEDIEKKIEETTKSVADSKGLSIVLKKEAVIYGGVDITPIVASQVAKDSGKDKK